MMLQREVKSLNEKFMISLIIEMLIKIKYLINMGKKNIVLIILLLAISLISSQNEIKQLPIAVVQNMPNMPFPYKMMDWKGIAKKQDCFLYNFDLRGRFLPLIWWDDSKINFPIRSFGLPSYIGSDQCLFKSNDYEALPIMGSLIGASLVGIDKSTQDGTDFVTMVRQFFNKSNGENLILDGINSKVGSSFWYDIWPSMAYAMIVDLYPNKQEMKEPLKISANVWLKAITTLSENRKYPDFNYTAFDFETNKGFYNKIWKEPDAAAGLAWLEFMCWKEFGGNEYLDGAKACMAFLENRIEKEGPFYELLMPYGAYLASRMNAELKTHYNESKFINWCFDGNNSDRNGWGVLVEHWGNYDVDGLVGQKKYEHYAFAMNTFSQAAALVPIVKYNPAYAKAIGKWILNLANASRLFYSNELPRNQQSSALWQGDPDHVICYEGCRKNLDDGNHFEVFKGILSGKGPYAIGDQVKTLSSYTDLAVYGSAWVGMLASIVDTTNIPGILKINCNATDFYSKRRFPTYLFYNPYIVNRTIKLNVGEKLVSVYDLVSKKTILKNAIHNCLVTLSGDNAKVLVFIPSTSHVEVRDNQLFCDDQIIYYHYQ
jgi:hypothetical protein